MKLINKKVISAVLYISLSFLLTGQTNNETVLKDINDSGLLGAALLDDMSFSNNYISQNPPEFLFDDKDSTSYQLESNASAAWVRMDFVESVYLLGLSFEGFIPEGALVFLQTEIDGEKVTLPSSFVLGSQTDGLIDISPERMMSDNLILRVEGENLSLFYLNEIDLVTEERDFFLLKKELSPVNQKYNRQALNKDYLLIDGMIGTVWNNRNRGLNSQIYWMYHNLLQEGFHSHEKWRTKDEILLDVATPGKGEFLKIFLTEDSTGELVLSLFSEDRWQEIETLNLGGLKGWRKWDLSSYGEIEQIRLTLEDPSRPWQPGHYGGIGEVELWGRNNPDNNGLWDLYNPDSLITSKGILFDYPEFKEKTHFLKIVKEGASEEAPLVLLNGIELSDLASHNSNGVTQWDVPVPYYLLRESNNTLKVGSGSENEILSVQLSDWDRSGLIFDDGSLSDGRLLSGRDYSEASLLQDFRQGILAIEEIWLFHGESSPDSLYLAHSNNQAYLSSTETEDYWDLFRLKRKADLLGIHFSGDLFEIEIVGSQDNIITPQIELIYPEAGVELPASATYHQKVIGITDYPKGQITINGVKAQVRDNYFWVEMRDLRISDPGEYSIEAIVRHSNGNEGRDTAPILVEEESINLIIDQPNELLETREGVFTFSGRVNGGYIYLEINGEKVDVSPSQGFEKSFSLEPGLNLYTFELLARDGETLLKREERQVYCQIIREGLNISTPVDGSYTNRESVTVSGSVIPWGLTGLNVNGTSVEVKGGRFSTSYHLSEGDNPLTVTAEFDTGETYEEQLTIHHDSRAPVLLNVEPKQGTIVGSTTAVVTGQVMDSNDITLFVNGKVVELIGSTFHQIVSLPLEGINNIEIIARDKAGNETVYPTFQIFRDLTGPVAFQVDSNTSGWSSNNRPTLTFSTIDNGIGLSHYEVSVNGNNFYPQESPYQVPYLPDSINDEGIPVIVRAYDYLGNYTNSTVEFYIDTVAAEVPSHFRTVPGRDSLEAKWIEADDEVLSYLLTIEGEEFALSSERGMYNEEINGSLFSYPVNGLTLGDILTFQLQSVDRAGNVSERVETIGLVGLSMEPVIKNEAVIVEYDDVNLIMQANILPDNITNIVIQEIEAEEFETYSINPIVSPIYSFTGVTEDGFENHVAFDDLYVGFMDYDEDNLPEGIAEQNLAVYYFDTNWSKWVKVDRSSVDTENNLIMFSTDHFTEFSVQATVVEDISPQELADVDFPLFSSKIAHSPVTISPQGGSASTTMTELVLPGKNGLDLELRRIYDSTTARSDAAGLNAYFSFSVSDIVVAICSNNYKDIFASGASMSEFLSQSLAMKAVSLSASFIESSLEKYLQNNGDYAYALGQGWRLNFPYLKTDNGGVIMRTPSGSYHNITSMETDWKSSGLTDNLSRIVQFEYHEGEDFTLKIYQSRTDIDISSIALSLADSLMGDTETEVDTEEAGWGNVVNNIASFQNYVPSWKTTRAVLYTKEGKIYSFDEYGRVRTITNETEDTITFEYNNLKLNYIEDSYGRKVYFDYINSYGDLALTAPQISKIRLEDDSREIQYTYDNDRSDYLGQSFVTSYKLSLPLLVSAKDVEGRTYDYDYGDEFLFASSYKNEFNALGIVLDILSIWTSGATSGVASALGISSLTTTTSAQFEWIFPIENVSGPGIGETDLNVEIESLNYTYVNFCDYFLGLYPTGVSIDMARQDRPYYSSLKKYAEGELVYEEDFSYNFVYGGYAQFYNSMSTVSNNLLDTEYSYTPKVMTRDKYLDYQEAFLEEGVFQNSYETKEVIPLNTGITRYSLVDGFHYVDTKTMSYNDNLRLSYEKTSQANDMYREINYSYDDWGNKIKITTFEQTGDTSTTQVIFNQYQENSIPDYTNPFDELTLNSSYIYDRLRGTVISETLSGGILDSELILPNRISWYDYNQYGQRTEVQTLIDDRDREIWGVKNYEYYNINDDFESGQLKATITLDGDEELLRTDYTYEYTDETYRQISTTHSVKQHNDTSGTDRVQWTVFDYPTGNPILKHDAEGFDTEYNYDNLDRVTEVVKPDDNGNNPVTSISYDDEALVTTVTDAMGASTIYRYNDLGQLITIEKENRFPESETITTELEYDGLGNISALIDPRRNRTAYLYDSKNRVILETYYEGETKGSSFYQKSYEYEDSLNRKIITNENGFMTYEYSDMRGNIIKKVDLDSSGWIYRTTESVYSTDNKLLKIEEPLDRITEYYYNASGQLSDELMPEIAGFDGEEDFTGRAWRHVEYNNQGLPTAEIVYLSEDDSGLPAAVPSDFINKSTKEYNGAGEMITEEHFFMDSSGLLDTLVFKHLYDKKGREVETIDGNGISTYNEYTPRDQLEVEVDALGNRTTYLYDSKDRLSSLTGPRGNSGNYNDLDFTIVYKYDDLDRLIEGQLPRRTDQDSKPVISLDYDERGNLLSQCEPDGGVISYTYNFRNWVERETRGGENRNGQSIEYVTSYNYDPVGNPVSVKTALGLWTNEYDGMNRLTHRNDPMGNNTSYSYDKLDNQIKVTDGNGNGTTFIYNKMGSLIEQIDASGYATDYEYDLMGNRTRLTDPRDNSWITKYDELARIEEEVNSRGDSAQYLYDNVGRLSQIVDPNGTVIEYLYYVSGLPQKVNYTNESQGKTQTEFYTYDEAGVVKTASLDGVVKEYNLVDGKYRPDSMGLITGQTVSFEGKSYSTNYSYDEMNRLSGISYNSGLEINQIWNNLAQLELIENYATDFSFNEVGYLESYSQGNGIIANYDFTDNGLLASLDYSNRDTLLSYSYGYDKAGNMTTRNEDTYGYDVKNQLITASIEGDSLASEEYVDYALPRHSEDDILGQEEAELVETVVSLDGAASSIVIDYTYPKRISKVIITPEDIDHRITADTLAVYTSMFNNEGYYDEVEDVKISLDEDTGEITIEFESSKYARYLKLHCHYNELNRDGSSDMNNVSFKISGKESIQAWALVGGRNEYYIYDGKGNRTSKSIMSTDILSDNYKYYSDSDLLKFNGTYYYTYDDNGNMIEKGTKADFSGDEVHIYAPHELTETAGEDYDYFSYQYDLKNRLESVYKYDSTSDSLEWAASYLYDIDNYRVSKTNRDELTTDFVFDLNGKILEEISGDTTIQYVFIKERHLARVEDDETLFYGTDHVNSPVLMTDAEGNTVWSGDVSPFGDYTVIDSDEYEELALKFTGKDMDEDVGLYYFNARWYDAETGRFITEDPIRDGLNWYGYVRNNPLRFIDPTGLISDSAALAFDKAKSDDFSEIVELEKAQQNTTRNLSKLTEAKNGEYNNKYLLSTTSESWAPGSEVSQTYANVLIGFPLNGGISEEVISGVNIEGTGKSISYTHAGIDRVPGSSTDIISPLFTEVLNVKNDSIVLNITGTDHNIKIQHVSPTALAEYQKGTRFSAGDKIAPFPIKAYGDNTSGPHIHFMEGVPSGGRGRAHVNPDTHGNLRMPSEFAGAVQQHYLISAFGMSFPFSETIRDWNSWAAP